MDVLQGSATPGHGGAASSSQADTDAERPVAKVGCSAVLHICCCTLASKAALVCLPAKPVCIRCRSALQEGLPAHQCQHVAPRLRLLHTSPCHFQGSLTLTLSGLSVQALGYIEVSQLGEAVLQGTEGALLKQLTRDLDGLSSEQFRRWQIQVALRATKSEVSLLCHPVRAMREVCLPLQLGWLHDVARCECWGRPHECILLPQCFCAHSSCSLLELPRIPCCHWLLCGALTDSPRYIAGPLLTAL